MDFTILDAVAVTYEHLGVCFSDDCLPVGVQIFVLLQKNTFDLLLQLPDVECNASGVHGTYIRRPLVL